MFLCLSQFQKESFFPCSFAIKIILGITFGILLYQCVLLSWEISLAKQVENNSLEMLQKSYVSKSEDGMVKIYWAVNGMKQDDPILIEFIRENVLVKPSYTSTKGLFINDIVSKPRPSKFLPASQYLHRCTLVQWKF